MGTCTDNAGSGFIGSVTSYLDCQSQNLGSGAWAALASPGGSLTLLLTGLLTILIALIGYRLLLGAPFTVRDATLSFVKVGAVFALATSWTAYRALVYDLVTDGPAQLVSEIGPRAGIIGSDGTLVQRLDSADRSLVQLSILGVGQISPAQYREVPPPLFIGFDSFALGGARIMFLITAIAGLGIVRLVAGLMLALGPFFIAFLLFEGTRSLFEGWVRVIAGSAIGAVGISLVLGLELGLLEPWLASVLARRGAGEALPAISTELFVMTSLCALLVVGALYACFALTRAFRLAPLVRIMADGFRNARQPNERTESAGRPSPASESERSRAAAVSAILIASSRRDGELVGDAGAARWLNGRPAHASGAETRQTVPLGRSFNRRNVGRASAMAAKRDKVT